MSKKSNNKKFYITLAVCAYIALRVVASYTDNPDDDAFADRVRDILLRVAFIDNDVDFS